MPPDGEKPRSSAIMYEVLYAISSAISRLTPQCRACLINSSTFITFKVSLNSRENKQLISFSDFIHFLPEFLKVKGLIKMEEEVQSAVSTPLLEHVRDSNINRQQNTTFHGTVYDFPHIESRTYRILISSKCIWCSI